MELANPYGVDPALDRLPAPEAHEPGSSENLVCVGNDAGSGIAFYAHLSRIAPDPALWEGVLCMHLPNGDTLASRSFGESHARGHRSRWCDLVHPCPTL